MPLYPVFRFISVSAYLLIFLYGGLLSAPMFVWVIAGSFSGDFVSALVFGLPGLSLIALACLMVIKQTKATIIIECISFVLMLVPIVYALSHAGGEILRYHLFTIPALLFVVLFPISVVLSYQKYRRNIRGSEMSAKPSVVKKNAE